ncbi:MAG TPA: TetR/AcrR family transcriptional regulator [Candidatus Limnocylindrales bacterium]|nr:TetR/AcrR family transcriptional regulator [Candidatus Limnocylindrales bacterium]
MARTLDPEAHSLRRDAYTDAAQRLIQTKGYEQLSIQEVIDELGTSKGAFYHYFGSKESLLEAVIERMTDAALALIWPIVDDPKLAAIEKLQLVFSTAAAWKGERKEFFVELLQVWMSAPNSVVREHFRREAADRITPLLTTIIHQGMVEGTFTPTSSDGAAAVLISMLLGANDVASHLFLARQAGTVTFDEVVVRLAAFTEAYERVLGLPVGSWVMLDDETLHLWFD